MVEQIIPDSELMRRVGDRIGIPGSDVSFPNEAAMRCVSDSELVSMLETSRDPLILTLADRIDALRES